MTRAATGLAALALLVCLAVAPGLGAPAGTAAAADCAWQRHSKRVVKRVKREGGPRRVVRLKHWWSCEPLAAPPAPGPAPGPAPSPALPATPPTPVPTPEPEPPPRRVSVKAEEFSLTLSRLFVVAGEVTVELNNQGEDPHDLKLEPAGSAGLVLEVGETDPGQSRVADLDLSPGTYRLWCSLPQHEEWGMKVNLEVRDG